MSEEGKIAISELVKKLADDLVSWEERGIIREFNMSSNRSVKFKHSEVGLDRPDKVDVGDWHITVSIVLATAAEVDLKRDR